MGDRALVQFKCKHGDNLEVSPVIYLHWLGHRVHELLERHRTVMAGRTGDVPYAAARFVGVCCEAEVGNLSIGIWNQTEHLTPEDSHGDAGCFVVDVDVGPNEPWRVDNFG